MKEERKNNKILPSKAKKCALRRGSLCWSELQDASDWKESGADRLPLPDKTAKARAILARTSASGVVAHDHV